MNQFTQDSGLLRVQFGRRPSWSWSYDSWIYNYLRNRCLSPLMLWVRIPPSARCTTLCDKVCQWLAAGLWFSPGPFINKTDLHDITEILLKVALNTIKPKPNLIRLYWFTKGSIWMSFIVLLFTYLICDFMIYHASKD